MREITFKKHKFEYDETCLTSYAFQKGLARGTDDLSGFYVAIEKLFAGRDVEYSEVLGGSVEAIGDLFRAVLDDAGREAKN